MFNAKEVVDRVKQGNSHPSWRIYCGNGTSNYLYAFTSLVLAIPFIWLGIMLFQPLPGILIIGILCTIATIFFLYKAVLAKRSILVILPEGAVQCYAGDLRYLSWLHFSTIKRIGITREIEVSGNEDGIRTTTFYWLDIYSHNGEYRKWQVPGYFGDTAYLCKNIIAAYDHYIGY
jgi:hypothetical protein